VREIMQKNLKCEVNVAYLAQGCSELVRNLLHKMLEKNPDKRITIKEAL
jgi:serine/threonine protein kinase